MSIVNHFFRNLQQKQFYHTLICWLFFVPLINTKDIWLSTRGRELEKATQHRSDTNTLTWCLPDSPANEAQLRSVLLNFFCHGPLFQHCTGESLKRKQSHCNRNPETRQNLCDGVRWYCAEVVQRLWRRRLIPET